jgi:cytidylate kinase
METIEAPGTILLISGPPGAGKSTVARLLVDSIEHPVAYIEGDTFWQFIAKSHQGVNPQEVRARNARIVIQAMVASAIRYARGGYQTVLDFSIPPWALKTIVSATKDIRLDFVVICPSESVCAIRAATRTEGVMPDYTPYREFHRAFCTLGPLEGHALRTDDATPNELVIEVRKGLTAGTFRLSATE